MRSSMGKRNLTLSCSSVRRTAISLPPRSGEGAALRGSHPHITRRASAPLSPTLAAPLQLQIWRIASSEHSTMSTATHADSDDALPTTAQLSAAKATHVLDSHGTRISVASLFDDAQAQQLPLVLVFTRHFHCGMCKEFVRALAESSILTRVELIIVGPGEAAGVETYKASVGRPPFKFFADPQLHLYHALGVTRRNLELGGRKGESGRASQGGPHAQRHQQRHRPCQVGNPGAQGRRL
ncbi:hypothetical protein L1887_42069 [Cichorium endivia]|nr:hypothetical protein L1887_42069 [Cichorium endivia]